MTLKDEDLKLIREIVAHGGRKYTAGNIDRSLWTKDRPAPPRRHRPCVISGPGWQNAATTHPRARYGGTQMRRPTANTFLPSWPAKEPTRSIQC
jgi:hypothetical protein